MKQSQIDQKAQEIRKVWLPEEYHDRLGKIIDFTMDFWEENAKIPWYTIHDNRHSICVEYYVYKLLPLDRLESVDGDFRFYLLAAVWLHDIGMNVKFYGKKDTYDNIRKEHHLRSRDFVNRHQKALGLDRRETHIISELCKFHRKKENIDDIDIINAKITNSVKLIAAYLRLADSLHIDQTRAPHGERDTLLLEGMKWENALHWLKSSWIDSIELDLDKYRIEVHLITPESEEVFTAAYKQLIRLDLQEELDSVKDILIRGQISYFLEVVTRSISLESSIEGESKDGEEFEFQELVSTLAWQDSASSTDLAKGVLRTLQSIAEEENPFTAFSLLEKYHAGQLKDLIYDRHYNYLLKKINTIIEDALNKHSIIKEEVSHNLDVMFTKLSNMDDFRREGINNLVQNAKPLLTGSKTILLYGFSRLVIHSLENLDEYTKESTNLLICSASNKTQFTYNNEIVYQDGMMYANELKKIGFKNLRICPDNSAVYFLKHGLIDLVLLGANGINTDTCMFSHLAGVTAYTEVAKLYNVMVVVIADSMKFGTDSIGSKKIVKRNNNWLTGIKSELNAFEDQGIQIANPRTELVELVDSPSRTKSPFLVVTETGIYPGNRIPSVKLQDIEKNRPKIEFDFAKL